MKYGSFTLVIYLLLTTPLLAQQSDTLRTTVTQEECHLTSEEINRFICYVTRANVEEKTLIKFGLSPISGTSFVAVGPTFAIGSNFELALERKLSPSFSALLGIDAMVYYSTFNQSSVVASQMIEWKSRTFRNTMGVKLGARYYYAKARHIRTGKSANNFSGNYVSIQLARPVSYYVSEKSFDASTQTFITRRTAPTLQGLNLPTLGLLWGLQRRLSHFGYVDLNAGPQLMRPQDTKSTRLIDFSFQFNAIIGLGW